ncbi:MAG: hypothetical protein IT173_00645 [Acidobacteria bacterium]|nr:hypothetical protein [Acidobacteriota bacterium]
MIQQKDMMRPNEKLLRDMSIEELATESHWHAKQAARLLQEVEKMRERALGADEREAEDILYIAAEKGAEAEAHIHQSNLIDALHASKLSDQGVGVVVHAAAP